MSRFAVVYEDPDYEYTETIDPEEWDDAFGTYEVPEDIAERVRESYSPFDTSNSQVDKTSLWAYNTCIMKHYKRLKMKAKATRAHLILFCKDTPFKQKRVESKMLYKRNTKHKGRTDE